MKSISVLLGCEARQNLTAMALYTYTLHNTPSNIQLALLGSNDQQDALMHLANASLKEWESIIGDIADVSAIHFIKSLLKTATKVPLPDTTGGNHDEFIKQAVAKLISSETENEQAKLDIVLPQSNPRLTYLLSYYLSMFGRKYDCLLQLQGDQLVNIPFILDIESDLPIQNIEDVEPLKLNLKQKTMHVGDQEIKLSPTLFAWYSWLAVRRAKLSKEQHSVTLKHNLHDDFLKHFSYLYSANQLNSQISIDMVTTKLSSEDYKKSCCRVYVYHL